MTAPLLAALLRRALPELRVLDGALASGGLYPWWPGAMLARTEPCELLAGFGVPPLDPALQAGAPEAWGGDGPRLVVTQARDAAAWLATGTMVLTRAGEAPAVPRIMLILGLGGMVAQHDLLPPEGMLETVLPALSDAAQDLAGPGWEVGLRSISPRLAAVTLFAPADAPLSWALEAERLLQWREAPGRLRVLLGVLPSRALRIAVRVEGAPAALFLDGAPHAGDVPFLPGAEPVVLGLGGAGVVLRAVEIVGA